MINEVKNRCELLAQNKSIFDKAFIWDMDLMCVAAASILTTKGVLADKDKVKECEKILKSETNVFSDFRGNTRIPLIAGMMLADDPLEYFKRVKEIHSVMNKKKWTGSEYRIMAAMTIVDHVGDGDYEQYIDRADEIYEKMKGKHCFLTSDEDIPFAAMLAVSDLNVDYLISDMEQDFVLLKKLFHDQNALQSLTHVLSLQANTPEEKCARVASIFGKLKAAKHKPGTSYELPVLGTLSMIDLPEDQIVELIIEADEYLKTMKGFGNLAMGSDIRRMFASQMVLSVCTDTAVADGAIMGSMLALTIAIEVSLIICASVATTSAASSS